MYVCVIGGANIDIISSSTSDNNNKDSHMGIVHCSSGGVGRNIAENLAHLSVPTMFITAVGNDILGKQLLEEASAIGIDCSSVHIDEYHKTSCYNAFLDSNRDLLYAVADMNILECITPKFINTKKDTIANASICVLDTNLPQETLKYIVQTIKGPKYVLDTVSGVKAKKIKDIVRDISLIKTNRLELLSFVKNKYKQYNAILQQDTNSISKECLHAMLDIGQSLLAAGLQSLVVSLGRQGLWYIETQDNGKKYVCQHIVVSDSIIDTIKIKNTTGAGDSLCAGMVYALYNKHSLLQATKFGLTASIITIQDNNAVSQSITPKVLEKTLEDIHNAIFTTFIF